MFKFNYSVGDIKSSDLGKGIVCLGREGVVRGEGSEGKGGEGSGGKGGGKWGQGGKEVGNAYPLSTPSVLVNKLTCHTHF